MLRGSLQFRAPTQPSCREKEMSFETKAEPEIGPVSETMAGGVEGEHVPCRTGGMWPDLVAELLQGEGLVLSEVGNPCSPGG